jgi:hypothetical protein
VTSTGQLGAVSEGGRETARPPRIGGLQTLVGHGGPGERERARVCVPFDSVLSAYGDMAEGCSGKTIYSWPDDTTRERGGGPSGGLGDPTQGPGT